MQAWAQLAPRIGAKRPLYKRVLLALVFFLAFLLLDGSSAPGTQWEGSPPRYFPVGLSVALLFVGGIAYSPLVMLASIAAVYLNYHRPFLSWCGIPGATALYLPYVLAIKFLREHLQINSKRTRIREIGVFTVVLLVAEIPCAVVGMCTLWGDGLMARADMLGTLLNWWESDSIAIICVTPFLIVHVAARLESRMYGTPGPKGDSSGHRDSTVRMLESVAQFSCIIAAVYLVFGFAPAVRFQPLYILASDAERFPGADQQAQPIPSSLAAFLLLFRGRSVGLITLWAVQPLQENTREALPTLTETIAPFFTRTQVELELRDAKIAAEKARSVSPNGFCGVRNLSFLGFRW